MTSDADQIRNLVFRYAELIDAGRLDEVGALFAHATVDWGGHVTEGAEAVAAQLRATTRLHDDGTPRTAHLVTNVIVEVGLDGDADRAVARSRYCVVQATEVLPLAPIVVGRYTDAFARVDGAWRFAARRYHVDLLGDLSQHLPADLVAMLEARDRDDQTGR